MTTPKILRTLVAGCGQMGSSHARAYHHMPEFEIVGLVSRGQASRERLNGELGGRYPTFGDYTRAIADTRPDVVCISTYTESHAEYAIVALEAGAHVFLEKPVAAAIDDAVRVVETARRAGKALVVGYILQVHPAWRQFTDIARTLGKPLVMRMNLNQQSAGRAWATHQNLLASTSPIVDCGVHYVDVMCRMTGARPVSVNGIGARLTDDIAPGQVNYGHLQVTFDDGSIGWYEAGWGPMMSETAFFVKDVVGPKGSVSIVAAGAGGPGRSAELGSHTTTEALKVHHAALGPDGRFAKVDELLPIHDEPDHDELCLREQQLFLGAITGQVSLEDHWRSALDSLRIVLAADRSMREQRTIRLISPADEARAPTGSRA